MRNRVTLLAVGFCMVWGASARATLMLQVEDATMVSGGPTYVDVMVSSTTGNDVLDSFGFDFQISTLTGTGAVGFVNPQPADYLTDPKSNYVFLNNSGDVANSFPVGNVTQTTNANDTYSGGDFTSVSPDVPIGTTPQLLARLEVTGDGGTQTPNPGDTFAVTLEPVSSGYTSFSDSGFNAVVSNVDTSPVFGVVTDMSPSDGGSNVPEPSTLVALVSGGVGLCLLQGTRLVRRLGRKRRAC
jgi:hypothetical protein